MSVNTDALLQLAIKEAPAAITLLKNLFAKDHPDAPFVTDEQVAAAYMSAFTSSLLKDDVWLAAHPEV